MIDKRDDFLPVSKPLINQIEINAVSDVLKGGWLTMGPKCVLFEKKFIEYTGAKYAVSVNSCTSAIHLALICCDVGKNDEVITTPFTFASTGNTIVWQGAKPVFVDIDEKTFNIDVSQIEDKITDDTKAIVPVHYGGQSCDMDKIIKVAKKYDLYVIEDAAHAIGAKYMNRNIGTIGDMTCFSFYATKNMTTGEGGMLVTDNEDVARKAQILRLHGIDKDAWKRYSSDGSWRYDIKYAGFKYNMTDIQAAIGIEQLKKLDMFNQKRVDLADQYNKRLSELGGIITPNRSSYSSHVYHLYPIRLDKSLGVTRDHFITALKSYNIGTSVHFIPLHLHSFYQKNHGYKVGDFPVSEKVFDSIVSLPMSPAMNRDDVDYVVDVIESVIKGRI